MRLASCTLWLVLTGCVLRGQVGDDTAHLDAAVPVGPRDPHTPLDILFVIDNSGSMADEQQNLAFNASSLNDPESACNVTGFDQLQPFVDVNREVPIELWPFNMQVIYHACGMLERLLLWHNKFHIGVITTDLNDCDRPFGQSMRGSVPQRGCLQTSEADPNLALLTWRTPDLRTKFYNIVHNVGTFGSPFERGLEAARHYLMPGHSVPPPDACDRRHDCRERNDCVEASCTPTTSHRFYDSEVGDHIRQVPTTRGPRFLRGSEANDQGQQVPTALIVVFVTDEDDCSHTEVLDEYVSGNTALCYDETRPELLIPVETYVDYFQKQLKSSPNLVDVAVIGGLLDSGNGMQPAGCKYSGSGPTNECSPAHGNSVATCTACVSGQPVCMCHPVTVTCNGVDFPAANCCTADAAKRYHALASQLGSQRLSSICSPNFKQALIDLVADVR